MRVVLVCPYDLGRPGGVQGHVFALASALRAAGDEVLVLGAGAGNVEVPRWVGLGRSIGVRANGSVAPVTGSPWAWSRTREAIARLRPDVVHVHEPMMPMIGPAAVMHGVAPVVGTFHAWAAQPGLYGRVRPISRRVDDRLTARIAVSPAAASFHAVALGRSPDRFDLVPNGVDVPRFAPARDRATTEPPTLLVVGRLEPRKGPDIALRVWRRLRARGRDVRLEIVGDGPMRARLAAAVPAADRRRVHFAGRVDDAALVEAHRRASAVLIPARGGESFGIVLLEAMAAGTPVVASDIPGYRSVVHDGVDGRLVAVGDVDRWADAVEEVLDQPALRMAQVAAGIETAERHDWPVVAGRVRRVLGAAASGGGRRA